MNPLSWCCVIIIAFGLFASGAPKGNSKPADLSLTDLQGNRVRLRDLRGKIVVLNFWATWCGPCKEEMPRLVAAEKEYKARGVMFLGASLDEPKTRARIPEFLSKYQVEFPVWSGATGDDLAKLGMGEAVPATAFLDPEGRIVARVSGEIRAEEIKERIEWLLGGGIGPAPQPFVKHLDK
jgi:thiol-disulfide isomerase/thioredoxin